MKECEEEGGRENLRLDGFFPALFLTFAPKIAADNGGEGPTAFARGK